MAGSIASGFGDEDDAMLSEINVTPLVDVVLVLLIVFMITVPAIIGSAPIKVNLPESAAVAMATEHLPIIISVRNDPSGELAIYLNDRKTTESGLRDILKELKEVGMSVDDQKVTLAADNGMAYGGVVKVMDILIELGLNKISLDTRHVESR